MNDFGSRLHKAQVLEASEHLEASVGVEPLTGQPVVLFRVSEPTRTPQRSFDRVLMALSCGWTGGCRIGLGFT